MDPDSQGQRLSGISTAWSLLQQAHGSTPDAAADARRRLLERYCGAVYHYLLGALRNEDAAAELFQEFALRFLRGDFRRADPRRGRFRQYVKSALLHLVTDYYREQRRRPRPLPADGVLLAGPVPEPEDTDTAFLRSWREELINRTWEALAQAAPIMHATLALHTQQPDEPSARLAEQLTRQLDKPFTPTQVRVSLHRARSRFAELLLDEVEQSLESPTPEELVQELRQLQLLKLCGPALERRGIRA